MIKKELMLFYFLFAVFSLHGQQKYRWVDSVYQSLTPGQRLAQLFIVPADTNHALSEGGEQNLPAPYTPGGIQHTVVSSGVGTNAADSLEGSPALRPFRLLDLKDTDQRILPGFPRLPGYLTLEALHNPSLAYKLAGELEHFLKVKGIDMVFHSDPVLTNTPSFDTGNTAESGLSWGGYRAFIEGFDDFPGARYCSAQPMPDGLSESDDVATAGACVSHEDGDRLTITGQLKGSKNYKVGKTEGSALLEGSDMVISPNMAASVKWLEKYLGENKVYAEAVEKKVKKVLNFRYDLHIDTNSAKHTSRKVDYKRAEAIIDEIRKESATVIDKEGVIPVKALDNRTFACLSPGWAATLRGYLDRYALFAHYDWELNYTILRKKLSYYNTLVIVVGEELSARHIAFVNSLENKTIIIASMADPTCLDGLRPERATVMVYENDEEQQKIVPQVIFGALEAGGRLPVKINGALSRGSGRDTHGVNRLGFSHPLAVKMDPFVLHEIDTIVHDAIRDGATPGCQVLVARYGKVVYQKAFGYYTYDNIRPVTDQTIYDIASITKVAATTQAIMFIEERGLIDLDKKIAVYLTDLAGSNKADMTVRDILTHQAGLWPYLPFWKQTLQDADSYELYYRSEPGSDYCYQISDGLYASESTRDSVWQWVVGSPLRKKPKGVPYGYKYSDMGYYILQRLIEKLINQPMEEFLQQNFYDPMGLNTLSYLPLCKAPLSSIAPTEYDDYFRKTLVYGLVHDQGAAMMGGVAGHAGVFSNALDLAKLMQMNLWAGRYGGQRYLQEGTVERFSTTQYASNRRGLGWDKPVVAAFNSPTSAYASKKCFGHSGFTGTAVWADPEFDLIYVFLSNRIYPDAHNTKLIGNNVRTRIQDLIYRSIFSYCATNGAHD